MLVTDLRLLQVQMYQHGSAVWLCMYEQKLSTASLISASPGKNKLEILQQPLLAEVEKHTRGARPVQALGGLANNSGF